MLQQQAAPPQGSKGMHNNASQSKQQFLTPCSSFLCLLAFCWLKPSGYSYALSTATYQSKVCRLPSGNRRADPMSRSYREPWLWL